MRDILLLLGLVGAFILGYYLRGLRITPITTKIVHDTITVTQAQPIYYTRYITKFADTVTTVDTVYIASLDTTINDVQVRVEYESLTKSVGTFNINAITTKPVYVPPDYYIELVGLNSFVVPLRTISFGAGRYLLKGSHLSLGAGGYITYYHSNPYTNTKYDYGLQLKLRYEF